jgi:hypothetical protein
MVDAVYYDKVGKKTRTRARWKETEEYKLALRLREAGLRGSRSWLMHLARERLDPPWSKAMQDQNGKVNGNERLKASSVVEYLQERGEYNRMVAATAKVTGDHPVRKAAFEKAWGQPLLELEEEWRAWLLPDGRGILQGLGEAAEPAGPATLLKLLDGIRKSALYQGSDYLALGFDRDLSDGARLHAEYLHKNPAQKTKWPDAHEEWPDRAGFTPQGSWAGLHSVISFGVKQPQDAVESWMGTFYHRLPLLDAGLVHIGWGFYKGIAVLDAASLRGPWKFQSYSMWPPPGAKDIPLRFVPELPNPVPGERQELWGYPITVQLFQIHPVRDIKLQLYLNKERVDCHSSTPFAPTNPKLPTPFAFCLIPKRTLEPNATYEVRCLDPLSKKPKTWRFRTRGR